MPTKVVLAPSVQAIRLAGFAGSLSNRVSLVFRPQTIPVQVASPQTSLGQRRPPQTKPVPGAQASPIQVAETVTFEAVQVAVQVAAAPKVQEPQPQAQQEPKA